MTTQKTGKDFLAELVHYRTYAKYIPDEFRRETRDETIDRNMQMHIDKFPRLTDEIVDTYQMVREGKVVPSMRALDDTTPIRTLDGWKQLSDIKIGDVVFDKTGEQTLVEKTFHFDDVDLYKITFSDGATLTACDEHLWEVATEDDRANKKTNRKTRVVNTLHIKDYLMQGGKYNFGIYNPQPIKLPEKELHVDPYIMGHWLGDGYSNGTQYSTSVEDSAFLSEQYAAAGYPNVQSKSSNVWTWNVANLKEGLKKYDLVRNKHIPKDYFSGSVAQRIAFLQGLVDSDGCVEISGRTSFTNANTNIITGVCELLASLGIKYTTVIQPKKKKIHQTLYVVYFTSTLQIARLPRKQQRIRTDTLKQTEHRKIISVEFEKRGSASCLQVASESHTFLAGEKMIVTHNCLQFAGEPILRRSNRIFNCCFLNITKFKDVADLFFQSMSGAGVGYSVKDRHISNLPKISHGIKDLPPFIIDDSAAGWADSIVMLLENPEVQFDYSQIRLMGTPLSTGGTASGPKALIHMHAYVRQILRKAADRKLTSFEVHRICCLISDCVVVGGVRRSATIVLFDIENTEMLNCKAGAWWEKYPELARANNSAAINRNDPDAVEKARAVINACYDGGQAEPGLIWTNNDDWGVNPCAEISLKSAQSCNLSEINAAKCFSEADWLKAVRAATIIGTLQATYTDFKYIHPDWKKNAEEEALLGVSITGQAENQAILTEENLRTGAETMLAVNEEWAAKLGINKAHRIGTCKPSGSASSWLGTTAGIHAAHATEYLRRVRLEKDSKLCKALVRHLPAFMVDDPFRETDMIIQIPVRMHDNTLLRSQETAIQCLERMKKFYNNWILPSHREGANTHNVSLTINYHMHEKEAIREWMIENREHYYGISLIPFDGGDYQYLPYSQTMHSEFFALIEKSFQLATENFDFADIKEKKDNTDFSAEPACAGGACTLQD